MTRKPLSLWAFEERVGTHMVSRYAVAESRSEALSMFNEALGYDDTDDEVGNMLFHVTSEEYGPLKWLHRAIKADPEFLFKPSFVNLAVLDPAPVPEGALNIWCVTADHGDRVWVSAATAEDALSLDGGLEGKAELVPVDQYHTLPWLREMLLNNDPAIFTPTILAGD